MKIFKAKVEVELVPAYFRYEMMGFHNKENVEFLDGSETIKQAIDKMASDLTCDQIPVSSISLAQITCEYVTVYVDDVCGHKFHEWEEELDCTLLIMDTAETLSLIKKSRFYKSENKKYIAKKQSEDKKRYIENIYMAYEDLIKAGKE